MSFTWTTALFTPVWGSGAAFPGLACDLSSTLVRLAARVVRASGSSSSPSAAFSSTSIATLAFRFDLEARPSGGGGGESSAGPADLASDSCFSDSSRSSRSKSSRPSSSSLATSAAAAASVMRSTSTHSVSSLSVDGVTTDAGPALVSGPSSASFFFSTDFIFLFLNRFTIASAERPLIGRLASTQAQSFSTVTSMPKSRAASTRQSKKVSCSSSVQLAFRARFVGVFLEITSTRKSSRSSSLFCLQHSYTYATEYTLPRDGPSSVSILSCCLVESSSMTSAGRF
mmetsp:Transcript_27433/g.72052  ORF Transcript_27433/g.72052 Transcript_27433/m.72052 type:complete len:285 (-) Transcript_27433:151-1005(-)